MSSKNKLLIYLLSTTLVIPTFTTHTAIAKDNTDEVKTQENVTQDHSQSNENDKERTDSDQTDNNQTEQPSTEKDASDNHTSDKDSTDKKSTKETNKSSKNKDKEDSKDDENQNSEESQQKSNQSNQTTTAVTDKNQRQNNSNLVDQFYNNVSQSQSHMSDLLKPDKYDNSFSLTTLIQNLFNFNSNNSNNEQSENNTNNSTTSQDNSTNNDNSNSEDTSSNDNATSDSNNQNNQSSSSTNKSNQSHSSTKDNAEDSKLSDALSKLDQEDNKSHSSLQTSQPDRSQQSSDQSNNSSSDQTQSSKSTSKDGSSSLTDSALDDILDKYSEDSKKAQSHYKQKSKNQSTQTAQSSKNENPQLPTNEELNHKTKPVQSFENDIKQSNTRSTSLFQQLPSTNNEQSSDDNFNVVDSQDTRKFIKSIAKDAHKIGQKEDIYASVMMAQAILESDSGKSSLAQSPNFNLFGVKGNYNGASVNFNTLEADSNDQMYNINAGFRKYPNLKASLQDYADLIKNGIEGNPTIYKPTWKSEALTYKDATSHLSHSYATDPNYAKKLNSIIKHYNLTAFDKKRMPNLKKYNKTIGTDASGSDFKPFVDSSGSSAYPQGQCTWYVYNRMKQFGKSISGDLGDAHNWNNRAESEGYTVTHSPKNHTAVVFEAGQLGADTQYGHVAFVEKVNDDGSIVISESNVKGLGVISYRTIDADDAKDLDYVQGK